MVVDNASSDGSVEMVKKDFPQVKLIANKENVGFAKANNQGLKKIKSEYILLLNPDTRVKPGSLEKLIKFVREHPQAGIVGARLINPDGSAQPSVYHFPTLWRAIREYWFGQKGVYEKYAPQIKKPIEVEAVTGAAMLVTRKTIKKIGLLDERYFMYFEDLDYCQRVRDAGLKVYYLPQVEILHHHGRSAAKAGSKAYQYLVQSSKIYNGLAKYYLLFSILWLGQKWQKLLGKK
jgi:GT2 family glycosyltransferase